MSDMTDARERYAEIAVLSGSPQPGPFTYRVPGDLPLRRGMSVVVPWRTQCAVGIALEISAQSDIADPRSIERVLDPTPVLNARQLELAQWISDYYLAPIASCVSLFLPPGTPTRARASSANLKSLIPNAPTRPKRLTLDITTDQARDALTRWPRSKRSRVADLLDALCQQSLAVADAARLVGGADALKRWLASTSMATEVAANDSQTVQLAIDRDEAAQAAAALRLTASERRRQALVRSLLDGLLDESIAKRESGATRDDVTALIDEGLLRLEAAHDSSETAVPVSAPRLTAEQATATTAITDALDAGTGESVLLHGVTGSGKTEVYLAATDHALSMAGGVIVLVPEIALAPQTVARFEARFPGQVAVRHSQLKQAEAREQWRQVAAGEKRILIGARSALFAPMADLKLVIVDEEHEWTYKQQDPQPRYHAVTVVQELVRSWNVVTVLGSATPSVVAMAQARSGNGQLRHLTQRVQSGEREPVVIPLPLVDVVDLRDELAAGVRSVFSRELDDAVSQALQADEQVLLFLNRRGMSGLVCRACGEAVACNRCSITLTLHRPGPYLQCHECGVRQAVPTRCPACDDSRVGSMSFGTAQLEAEVRRRWGDLPITRWDRDTSRASGSHERLLREFGQGRSQVLIGTQMIAKGLDLPRVTVAGVINADLSLRESDWLAAERTYQLLSQVAGRAGRGARGGRVIIQTYAPDHVAVVAAAAHDYDAFYEPERRARAALDLPPYGRLARITVSRSTAAEAEAEAERVVSELRRLSSRLADSHVEVIGSAPATPARQRGHWRRHILLKSAEPTALLRRIDLGRGWSVDIDPLG